MVRKIVEQVPDDVLKADLERYRKRAIKLGATDARVISSEEVVIDERVRAKCAYPLCSEYGTNANCPPHVPDLDQVRRLVNAFRWAVFLKLDVPFEKQGDLWHEVNLKNAVIVSKIEAEAFYDGYYLAVAFGGRACKPTFCSDKECSALGAGQSCRYPLRARPTMHAVGMDVFRMATRQGWDVYPVGESTKGLVLVY